MKHVAILGGGSWGTALACLIGKRRRPVRLWVRRAALAQAINRDRRNAGYLPSCVLPQEVAATSDVKEALDGACCVFLVVPSHGLREVLRSAGPHFPERVPVVSATKGIENSTLMLVSEIVADSLADFDSRRLCVIGGPSFAREVANGVPTAICLAGLDPDPLDQVQRLLTSDRFRVYTSDDVVGVEVGGALKNVIAIAVGAADGLGFGHNSRAALITRGIAEITRLARHLGANPLTLAGLSGVGDLVLTCTGDLSRNRTLGYQLGRGRRLAELLANTSMVAEGVRTASSAHELASKNRVEMPIVTEVYEVLYEGKTPLAAVDALTHRASRPERDSHYPVRRL
ncbi:MAG: NAD(P)-dependent glycerol-3-phosphate dehydrogenase [Proteobacteria bacterium]|nr:NAD(P)-dependent glycerol-3-phosphate dehydrogenase [Pseudomonadota bacterium]